MSSVIAILILTNYDYLQLALISNATKSKLSFAHAACADNTVRWQSMCIIDNPQSKSFSFWILNAECVMNKNILIYYRFLHESLE